MIGYFGAALGQGETARAMLVALRAAGVPATAVALRSFPGQQRSVDLPAVTPGAAPHTVNLFYTNGDGMRGFLREHGSAALAGRYSIGVWPAETVPAPGRWRDPSRALNEIWAYSAHVQLALEPIVEAPVLRFPQPVPLPRPDEATRAQVGFPEGFVFHTMFDYASTLARKNPIGTVRAFRRAFAENSGAYLVIRSTNARRYPLERRALHAAAACRRDIRIVDGFVSPGRKDAMLAHCDCYVSLHRAEGFGLPLAEAMRLGRPVVATGWSGNLEFMTDTNSYLVANHMRAIGPGAWPYIRDGWWAEPDIDHAAELLRSVADAPEEAGRRGARAAEDLARNHDPVVVGELVRTRLGGRTSV